MNKKHTQDLGQITLTPELATSIIPVLENEITELGKLQTEAKHELHVTEKTFLKAKEKFNELDILLKKKQVALQNILSRIDKKEVKRIMKATSHLNAKKPGKILWGKEFVNILKAEQRFMTFSELKIAFVRNHPEFKDSIDKKAYHQINNMRITEKSLRQKMQTGEKITAHTVPLLQYAKDYWGLLEWFELYQDGKIMPKANYMKQFTYKRDAAA